MKWRSVMGVLDDPLSLFFLSLAVAGVGFLVKSMVRG